MVSLYLIRLSLFISLFKIKCLDKLKQFDIDNIIIIMYKLLVVYLFHLVIVFPYLGGLGYRLSNLDEEYNFQIDSKIILSVVSVGFIYQLILLWKYLPILFSNT